MRKKAAKEGLLCTWGTTGYAAPASARPHRFHVEGGPRFCSLEIKPILRATLLSSAHHHGQVLRTVRVFLLVRALSIVNAFDCPN